MPEDFYYSTSLYEKETTMLRTTIEEKMKNSFIESLDKRHGIDSNGAVYFNVIEKLNHERLVGDAHFYVEGTTFKLRDVDNDFLIFTVDFPWGKLDRPKSKNPDACCYVDFMPGIGNYKVNTAFCFTSINLISEKGIGIACRADERYYQAKRKASEWVSGEIGYLWFDDLFMRSDYKFSDQKDQSYFLPSTDKDIKNEIKTYLDVHHGFSEGLEGKFIRMLYFSAVTITTLGYGDIVPLTNRARMAIALESILGLILMGLFVSTIGKNGK